jgi:hypothetical protein
MCLTAGSFHAVASLTQGSYMSSKRRSDSPTPPSGRPPGDHAQLIDGALRFVTSGGMRFTVREELPADRTLSGVEAAETGPPHGSLLFESDVITYRVYTYPSDWTSLSGDALVELAIESRPPEPTSSQLAAPTVGAGGVLEFVDYTGERWRVVEDACGRISDPTARTRRCLVFTTALFVRRIYEFPTDWAQLSSEALIALSSAT